MENKVLGIILARGGSKSIPKKSIYPCAGKPLLYYTAMAAKNSKLLSRVIISTDDPEMAETAKTFGVEVPFMRPKELATDTTPDLPVIQHALNWLKEHENYVPDAVVHLRPTTPLKSSADIDKGIDLLLKNPDAESVRSICAPLHTPFKMYREEAGNPYLIPLLQKEYPETFESLGEPYNMPRQILPVIWRHSGYVDIFRPDIPLLKNSMSGKKILPLKFEAWRDIDIDSMKDLKYCEIVINELKQKNIEPWQ